MNNLVIFFILLGAFPFLFPETCRVWLERAQQWLVAYEEKRKRRWRAEEAVEAETREWKQWVARAKRTITKVKTEAERALLLAQIQAAGERFLAGVTRWEEGKPAHPAMKNAEEKTKAVLDLLRDGAMTGQPIGLYERPREGGAARSGAGLPELPDT